MAASIFGLCNIVQREARPGPGRLRALEAGEMMITVWDHYAELDIRQTDDIQLGWSVWLAVMSCAITAHCCRLLWLWQARSPRIP